MSHLSTDYSDPTDLKFGPAYSHLGSSNTIPGIRSLLQYRKTCSCQGVYEELRGACYSFGCSWSMFYNGCKFARGHKQSVRKFRLTKRQEEPEMECILSELATAVASLYKVLAPEAYSNQVIAGYRASDCRIGYGSEKPFSGVTACLDFCAHSHRDKHNMERGATIILTLKRPAGATVASAGGLSEAGVGRPVFSCGSRFPNKEIGNSTPDDQLHVLSQYTLNPSHVSLHRLESGSVCRLDKYPQRKRLRSSPLSAAGRAARNQKLRRRIGVKSGGPGTGSGRDLASSSTCTESAFSCHSKRILKHVNDLNETIYEIESENESELRSGVGIGIALTHGSLLIECAKAEMHCTTAVPVPDRRRPGRLSLVFYQHKRLNQPRHGRDLLHHHMAPVIDHLRYM